MSQDRAGGGRAQGMLRKRSKGYGTEGLRGRAAVHWAVGRRYKCGSGDRRVRVQVQGMASKAGAEAGRRPCRPTSAGGWMGRKCPGSPATFVRAAASKQQPRGNVAMKGRGCAGAGRRRGKAGPTAEHVLGWFSVPGQQQNGHGRPECGRGAQRRSYLEQHQNGRRGLEKSLQAV